LPLPFPFLLPLPSKRLLFPAEGLVIEPRILLNCGVGAERTVEVRERRETAINVEVFIVMDVRYATSGELLRGEARRKRMCWEDDDKD
jgi:hypothetical protein